MESFKKTNNGVIKKNFDQSLLQLHEQTRIMEQKLTLKIEQHIIEKEKDCQEKVKEIKEYSKNIREHQQNSWQFRFSIPKEKHKHLSQPL
ncbi:hypothetical protein [Ornithinibacillus halophilus]|uniref:Uncharacterized protein n=1 Tax=Ornithinibacillus halophilus TaxID=930117 RepID=A0A1M5CM74_9BACI|nr:hypothetical protein [Ornithinibacillus halophilus]SHF55828.1 hypothetical protein SAMN05216225_1001308 [Ornithinibacillus halophilus]